MTMWYKMLFLLLISLSSSISAPLVNDPLRNGQEPGAIYLKWVMDFNQDGISDVLLGEKVADEVPINDDPFPDLHGFGVYLGQKGGGYINTQYVDAPGGREEGGVSVDVSQCYVGYISEAKKYGIVTALSKWQRNKGIYDTQVVAYTVEGDHIKETFLGGVMDDPDHPNSYYNEYLSPAKRTKVQLQEVQIPK